MTPSGVRSMQGRRERQGLLNVVPRSLLSFFLFSLLFRAAFSFPEAHPSPASLSGEKGAVGAQQEQLENGNGSLPFLSPFLKGKVSTAPGGEVHLQRRLQTLGTLETRLHSTLSNGAYTVRVQTDLAATETAVITVSAITKWWVGFGISTAEAADGKKMLSGDLYWCNCYDGVATVIDGNSRGKRGFTQDDSQDATALGCYEAGGWVTVSFSRKLVTEDSNDREIVIGPNVFIYSIGQTRAPAYHGASPRRGSYEADLSTGESIETTGSANEELVLLVHGTFQFLVFFVFLPYSVHAARYRKMQADWLSLHQARALGAMEQVITVVAVAIALRGFPPESMHALIGFSTACALAAATLLGFFARPHNPFGLVLPVVVRRWVGLVHGLLSLAVMVSGWVAAFFGLATLYPVYSLWLPPLVVGSSAFLILLLVAYSETKLRCPHMLKRFRRICTRRKGGKDRAWDGEGDGVAGKTASQLATPMTFEFFREAVGRGQRLAIVNNCVYDVGSWLNSHPGGREGILSFIGTDATLAFLGHPYPGFASHGHSQQAAVALNLLMVSKLEQPLPLLSPGEDVKKIIQRNQKVLSIAGPRDEANITSEISPRAMRNGTRQGSVNMLPRVSSRAVRRTSTNTQQLQQQSGRGGQNRQLQSQSEVQLLPPATFDNHPAVAFKEVWVPFVVKSVTVLTQSKISSRPSVFEIKLFSPIPIPLSEYEPGAAVEVLVDTHETYGGAPRRRFYSMAASPKPQELVLRVRRVDEGAVSPSVTSLRPGGKLRLRGFFSQGLYIDAPIWQTQTQRGGGTEAEREGVAEWPFLLLIGGGTGTVPFLNAAKRHIETARQTAEKRQKEKQNWRLSVLFSFSTEGDVFGWEEVVSFLTGGGGGATEGKGKAGNQLPPLYEASASLCITDASPTLNTTKFAPCPPLSVSSGRITTDRILQAAPFLPAVVQDVAAAQAAMGGQNSESPEGGTTTQGAPLGLTGASPDTQAQTEVERVRKNEEGGRGKKEEKETEERMKRYSICEDAFEDDSGSVVEEGDKALPASGLEKKKLEGSAAAHTTPVAAPISSAQTADKKREGKKPKVIQGDPKTSQQQPVGILQLASQVDDQKTRKIHESQQQSGGWAGRRRLSAGAAVSESLRGPGEFAWGGPHAGNTQICVSGPPAFVNFVFGLLIEMGLPQELIQLLA